MTESTTVTWDKPGPGTWELDSSHAGPSPGRSSVTSTRRRCRPGMKEGLSRFGAPISHMEMHWVHGKFYRRLVPIVGGNRDLPAPPKPLLWLAAGFTPSCAARSVSPPDLRHQELARRARPVGGRVEARPAGRQPGVHRRRRGGARRRRSGRAPRGRPRPPSRHTRLHFRLHVSDMGPLGMLMVQLEDAGLHRDDTFRALVNASPATAAPAEGLRRIAAAVRDAGIDPAGLTSLDQVRTASPDAARCLDEHLQEYGWRLTTGYDIEDRCLAELPDVLLAAIRAAAGRRGARGRRAPRAHRHAPRRGARRAPRGVRRRGADARPSYGLRDENGPLTYEWPAGLLRRGLLEAGRRLAERGAIGTADEVFELRLPEVAALLDGAGGPSRAEIEERAATRRWEAGLDAPALLGPEEAPPPADALTPSLARMTRVILTVVGALEADRAASRSPAWASATRPTSVRPAWCTTPARRSPPWSQATSSWRRTPRPPTTRCSRWPGAIVTEEGGLLCHAAVIARELGLPAVIGARGAMTAIPDGATIEVDPVQGRVLVK